MVDNPLVMATIPLKEIIYCGTPGFEAQRSSARSFLLRRDGMELNYQDFDSVLCADFQNSFLGLFRFLLILSLGIREARGMNPLHVVCWR